jgi:hypothetical protein
VWPTPAPEEATRLTGAYEARVSRARGRDRPAGAVHEARCSRGATLPLSALPLSALPLFTLPLFTLPPSTLPLSTLPPSTPLMTPRMASS